ncbi:MAG: tetratricopeptide repeat protein [Chitinophagaceae bacterium]|nr:tetratricopeptide repeat protein [Chitinophagaceae bacterium]
MIYFRRVLLFFLSLAVPVVILAQEAAAVDSLKIALGKAIPVTEKVNILDELSRVLMNVNPKEADEYGNKLIAVAEESRDRKLMFKAYLSNGTRCSYFASQKAYSQKSIAFYNKALELARQNRMEEEVGAAQMHLSTVYRLIPDNDKALSFATLAEELKNPSLILNCYQYLSSFYSEIEDYDKAIDYMTMAYKKLDDTREKNAPYQKVIFNNYIGNLYAYKKNYDMAISYFELSIRMADSLKFSTLKIPAYVSLLNQYLRIDEPKKALDYLNSPPGDNLKKYLGNFGMASMIDQAYGVVYTELGNYDSARIYLERARPMFENSSNENNKVNFYTQLASFYRKSGDKEHAIEYYLKVKEFSEKNGLLENVKRASRYLDTLYRQSGDIATAGIYNGIYYQYKDSIETLKREKELTQVEAADEQQRQLRAVKEKEEKDRQRNNIQYLAITIGIVALFIGLVVLGMFKVSANTIKMIGFFAFLMFFEFIFLIFKKNIYSITKGEPVKDLLFMIGLAALLLPLHHWLEHKVIHYLTSHNRLTSAGHHIKRRLFRRTKEGDE